MRRYFVFGPLAGWLQCRPSAFYALLRDAAEMPEEFEGFIFAAVDF